MERNLTSSDNSRSFIGNLIVGLLSIYGVIIIAGAAAIAIYTFGLGVSLIPSWVLASSGGLFTAGALIAIKLKNIEGLKVGLIMLTAAALALGLCQMMDGTGMVQGPLAEISARLAVFIAQAAPITAGVISIGGAYALRFPQPGEQRAE